MIINNYINMYSKKTVVNNEIERIYDIIKSLKNSSSTKQEFQRKCEKHLKFSNGNSLSRKTILNIVKNCQF